MKVAVVGVGGVGGYISAKLIQSDADVTLVAPKAHVNAIQKNGLRVVEDSSEFCVLANIVETPSKEEVFDVVFLAVKSYNIEEALRNIDASINSETLIIPLSNGVEHKERIERLVPSIVCDAAVYILSHIEKPGVIRKKGKVFALTLSKEAQSVLSLLDKAALRYKYFDNAKEAIWKKYIFISAFATLTSYFDMSIHSVYTTHYKEAKRLLEEIASVAKSLNIDVSQEIEKSLYTASKLPQDASTSMHLDRQNSKQSEIETLCHYVIKQAKIHNVAVPTMTKMYECLT